MPLVRQPYPGHGFRGITTDPIYDTMGVLKKAAPKDRSAVVFGFRKRKMLAKKELHWSPQVPCVFGTLPNMQHVSFGALIATLIGE